MKLTERDLNLYEQFVAAVEDAQRRGKRIEAVSFTDAEYADFYQQAMGSVQAHQAQDLMSRKTLFGIKITVEQPKKKTKD